MHRRTVVLMAIAALAFSSAEALGRDRNFSINNDESATTCEQLHISFDREPASIQTQQLTVKKQDAQPLKVNSDAHGGVIVYSSDRADYSVKACKASTGNDAGRKRLEQIKVSANRGELRVEGPQSREFDWLVYFIIEAPKDANVDLNAVNAPISIRDFSGRAQARTTNGPIEVKNSSGTIDARAVNGPVAFSGSTGDVTLRAQNGPIDIDIESNQWQGTKLDAYTENGPVEFHIPAKFETAAVVETSEHSPFECEAQACNTARRTWNDNLRRIEFGGGSPVVKIANVNGPISIVDHKGRM